MKLFVKKQLVLAKHCCQVYDYPFSYTICSFNIRTIRHMFRWCVVVNHYNDNSKSRIHVCDHVTRQFTRAYDYCNRCESTVNCVSCVGCRCVACCCMGCLNKNYRK